MILLAKDNTQALTGGGWYHQRACVCVQKLVSMIDFCGSFFGETVKGKSTFNKKWRHDGILRSYDVINRKSQTEIFSHIQKLVILFNSIDDVIIIRKSETDSFRIKTRSKSQKYCKGVGGLNTLFYGGENSDIIRYLARNDVTFLRLVDMICFKFLYFFELDGIRVNFGILWKS